MNAGLPGMARAQKEELWRLRGDGNKEKESPNPMSLEVRLKRSDRIYRPGETVSGVLVITTKGPLQHTGISLNIEGSITLSKNVRKDGLFDSLITAKDPIVILQLAMEIAPAGRFPDGITELPFEFPLTPPSDDSSLFETYHGVYVNIQYVLSSTLGRGRLAKPLNAGVEFIITMPNETRYPVKPYEFEITPRSIKNISAEQSRSVPEFRITGRLHSRLCNILEPFTGELTVVSSSSTIKSIEIQLVRVEAVGKEDPPEATEIQNIQLAEGDVPRGQAIPIHMIFPRLFTSPTVKSALFGVDYELNLAVLFQDQTLVSENFPVVLYRTPLDPFTQWTA
ncbi:Down syndrome critical region protein 3 (DSCR3) [Paratrimastix pyriformis]|uniref:Down syndrome critical region protein 3 (DSCR3) n=1 Tax=Paratrimastix pyriformis TaxID=342808 RepID=A0ABQ8UVG4_9EUKA|nr:Down syndrome critical region protein 3 (DSCR3) [Paratrimastix pyriformis]